MRLTLRVSFTLSISFTSVPILFFRMDLSLCWLYAEYAHYIDTRDGENDMVAVESYDCCIQIILSIFADKKCLTMMAQTIKQAPLLTQPALIMIRDFCQDEENAQV